MELSLGMEVLVGAAFFFSPKLSFHLAGQVLADTISITLSHPNQHHVLCPSIP